MSKALEFFEKNLKAHTGAKDEEKFNLYSGLAALAHDIDNLDARMKHLEGVLVHIQSLVSKNMP